MVGLILILLIFAYSVFSHEAFIQQELVGIAHYWTEPTTPFFEVLFDPIKNDQIVGRFRYVEYLFLGVYWNLVKQGWIATTLHDYLAFGCVTLSTLFFYYLLRKRLSPYPSLLITAVFVFSTTNFMIVTWHYRAAKYLVTPLLLMVTFALLYSDDIWKRRLLISSAIVGTLTDPYFILLAPLLPIAFDMAQPDRRFLNARRLVGGILIGGLIAIFLNGVIGPWINPKTKLVVFSIHGKPEHLLNIANLRWLLELPADLLFPKLLSPNFAIALGVLFLGLAVAVYLKTKSALMLAFLLSLPMCAFMVRPDVQSATFASYYGQAPILFFLLACADIFWRWKGARRYVIATLFLCLVTHHFGKYRIYQDWTDLHVHTAAKQIANDRKLIRSLRDHFRNNNPSPFQIDYQISKVAREHFPPGYGTHHGGPKYTSIGHTLVPILFYREIQSGKAILQFHKNNTE